MMIVSMTISPPLGRWLRHCTITLPQLLSGSQLLITYIKINTFKQICPKPPSNLNYITITQTSEIMCKIITSSSIITVNLFNLFYFCLVFCCFYSFCFCCCCYQVHLKSIFVKHIFHTTGGGIIGILKTFSFFFLDSVCVFGLH